MDLLEQMLKQQKEVNNIRNSREKKCFICGKDLANEKFILVKDKKVCCHEHFKPGEDGWKLDWIL